VKFPDGFLWGAATAAHQVEGGNTNSDLWLLEQVEGTLFQEPSGQACDHFTRYRDDMALLKALGFSAYRFSVEWARIEPAPGEFSVAMLDHYRRMLAACHEHGLGAVVTMHHFTTPRWLAARGGWESMDSADLFARYCEKISRHLGDLIDVACTLNELNLSTILSQAGFLADDDLILSTPWRTAAARACGVDPDQFSSFPFCVRGKSREVMLAAHRLGAQALRSGHHRFPVGMTLSMQEMEAVDGGEAMRDRMQYECEGIFLEAARGDDFVGVQCYTRARYGPHGLVPVHDAEFTQMGYEFRPEALEAAVRFAGATAQVPVIVTENGVATEDDSRRIVYLQRALAALARCVADGVDVRGYFHWSLLDNFEWIFGYRPKFGLIAVDRETQRRLVKPSGHWLGRIAQTNSLPPHEEHQPALSASK